MQKESFWRAKGALLQAKRSTFEKRRFLHGKFRDNKNKKSTNKIMTRHLRFLFVALLTIACSLVGKAAEGDTYKLVTDASELKSGDIVVIASKDKAVAMGAPNDKKEKYLPVTGIKITDDVLAYKEGFTELLLEGEAGKWYFKYGNGYIYAKSTTSTVLSFDTIKKNSANISISNGNASIGFDIVANSSYLSYSTKTSNFGYYNSIFGDHGVPVQIYKKQRRANGITIDKTSVEDDLNGYKGEAKQYVSLTNPNNLPITYTSSNPYVATVDESGNVKLVSWGKTTITVSYPGSEVYESATTSYELNVINSETSYDEKFIVFAADTDKGSNSTILGRGDKLSKENVTIQSTWAGFKKNPYELYAGSTTTISTTKGKIVRIEMLGCGHLDIVNSDKGTFDKGKSDAVWTGSEKSVNFQTNSGTTTPTVSTFRVYVEYPNVKTFEYNENKDNNIEAWENSDITLNRTLVANKWNTLCVPFAISEEEIKANFGEGTLVEKFEAVNGNTVNFADATSIEPGVPYLIKPTVAGTTYTFNGKEVSADAPKAEGNADVTFQGIYSPTDITKNGTVKAAGVTEDGKVLFVNPDSKTKAFRCFFTISDNASITPAMLKVSIKGVETAINSIVMDNSNATDNAVYNLQGQRVNGNSLTKGIYIKNGKKFAVK